LLGKTCMCGMPLVFEFSLYVGKNDSFLHQ